MLTLSRPSLGHTDPSGAAPWALIPLFLSLAWAQRPLSLSLSISLARAGLAPPFSRGLCSHIRALHKLVPHHFLLAALSLVTPPACPKSLLCLSQSHWSFFLYICVMGVNCNLGSPRKLSWCWLGAILRYWNVVASCFHFVTFTENTSAPVTLRASFSQPIL